MLERFIQWLLQGLLDLGYPGIVALMAMESSVLPMPSELVMPPAGYWVAKGEMNVVIVLVCGVLGSILGSLANYAMAHFLGRPFLRRFGKYFLISDRALERSDRYFAMHGEISTLVGRILPVIRHLISIPAGLARMSLPRFVVFTGLGALIWCGVLTGVGYFLGLHEAVLRNDEVQRSVRHVLMVVLPLLACGVWGYLIWHRRRVARSRPG